MIIKTFEIIKKKFDKKNFFLIYGENEGHKKRDNTNSKKSFKGNLQTYDEGQILNNDKLIYEEVLNHSLFEKEKL